MTPEERYPSYRAPKKDREVFCAPRWDSMLQTLPSARAEFVTNEVAIAGVPLFELARDARSALVVESKRHTKSYLDLPWEVSNEGPLILTGHQPELVHPGVWLKNFAASRLAKSLNATAVSLIIDSDLCRKPSIRVPTGTVEAPQVVDVSFDDSQAEAPYESRVICNPESWKSFGDRVTKAISPLVANPMIAEWWPADPGTESLGHAIAQARHRQEASWGSQTLELPQSVVCQSDAFRRFALHLLTCADRVRSEYNGSLAEYRKVHRLRSPAQPLPDLQQFEDWTETPFWIWSEGMPARRALYVRQSKTGLMLSDRHDWQGTLPAATDTNIGSRLQTLAEWENTGVKIRTRALITTLYARLVLADTFIHGIGGAKYDQVTERLCERLFGLSLPPMLVLSGTLRLPIEHETVQPNQIIELQRTLREMRYHPEVHLEANDFPAAEQRQIQDLVDSKRHWVQTAKTESNAAERHAQIEGANQRLQPWLASQRREIEQEVSRTVSQNRANQLLESREYPFCLFPSQLLQDFLLDF